jgi:protoporphyrinogen oxidase
MTKAKPSIVCIGAGPAGLTAGYLLAKQGASVTILEQDPIYVGGISRTATYKGFAFDIGGHRFFSKSAEVNALWTELLGNDFLDRPRKSRIYYRGQLFEYPIQAFDALFKLGPFEALRCVLSYLEVKARPEAEAKTFEEWVTNRFGTRLFEIFFKTYTEKVWGMKCSEISADWAAQRIKDFSLSKAIWHAIAPQKSGSTGGKVIKTLINSFRYPRRGPGMMWEETARRIGVLGGDVLLDRQVTRLQWQGDDASWLVTMRDSRGAEHILNCDHVISTMPMRELVRALSPAAPDSMRRAADGLRYRDFLTVALIVKDRNVFDDNWIYIHEPGVKVGRIQNYKSWSPEMVPDARLNCYGLEYFCFEGDGLWAASDAELIRLASDELVTLGLADRGDILDGTIVRQPKAYPVYDEGYQDRVAAIRQDLEAHYPALHLVGRNGMHKYNNQDHAMMTAMLTVENIMQDKRVFDVWQVNQDAEYHEEGETGTVDILSEDMSRLLGGAERLVPRRA